jgi:hypothetical protein
MFIRIALSLGALTLALVATSSAQANYETLRVYWGQNIAFYGEYHTTGWDSGCRPYSESSAEFHSVGWATVALIDTGGTWRFSTRSNNGIVQAIEDPNSLTHAASWRKKALCKNSGSTTISMTCSYWFWVEEPVRSGCA